MNKERRNRISKVIAQLEALRDEIADISSEEEECFDNLPEGLQESERGEAMQEAVENLESATDSIDEVIDSLTEASQ